MPRTIGDSFIHVSKLDYIVEQDSTSSSWPRPISAMWSAPSADIASLVKDGDCLQLGIGAIPDAVLLFLKDGPGYPFRDVQRRRGRAGRGRRYHQC